MSLLLSAVRASQFYIPTVVDIASTDNPLTGSISFQRSGDIISVENSEWYRNGLFNVGDYFEIYAEEVGGPTGFTGTFTTWLPLTEARTWALERSGVGIATGEIQFSIRRTGDTDAVIIGNTTFNVEVIV